jgi:hypothetical protein
MKNLNGLLLVAFSFLAGCAGTGTISQRGTVVMSGESVKAFAIVHAYSQDRGGKVFVVSAVSGTDADGAREKAPSGGTSVPVDTGRDADGRPGPDRLPRDQQPTHRRAAVAREGLGPGAVPARLHQDATAAW